MKDCNLPAPGRARYRVEYRTRGGFVVVNPAGHVVYGPCTRELAETKCDRLQKAADATAKIGPRPCLCCGATFQSEGIHNRMCNGCRRSRDPLSAYGYVGAGDGRRPRKSAGA
ncbi:hypothetical protein [Pararhodobacter zhoushanensis]|uniref:Uncharacterized protein n=1 Tax=Pararhodobacter zhoushanensis TaxID=2479545 RepID=A0ABT3H2P8_9RHOB|nr:hypothetical protein [Pararhodobacter zhoushanensis]MCW1934092.1 hypothetical protein [Pararhodobacter zhoushanensis]